MTDDKVMTDLDMLTRYPHRFPWGVIQTVHRIDQYAFVEYFKYAPGSARNLTGRTAYSVFVNERSISRSAYSLDEALVIAIAYKRDGQNSRAAHYFMKMTGKIEEE